MSSKGKEKETQKRKYEDIDDSGDDLEENEEDEDNEEEIEELEFEQNKKKDKNSEDMRLLMEQFTEDQSQRYEYYRRSSLQKASVKKLIQSVTPTPTTINDKTIIAMSGITKVFVGEIVETARSIMDEWGETGPLLPKHVREAYRRLYNDNKIPSEVKPKKKRKFNL